jgi:hypothetical protein
VIRTVRPTKPSSPQAGSKDHHWQQKEDAGDLKPQNSADPAERAHEACHTLSNSMRCQARGLAGPAPCCVILGDRPAARGRRSCPFVSCLHGRSYALAS